MSDEGVFVTVIFCLIVGFMFGIMFGPDTYFDRPVAKHFCEKIQYGLFAEDYKQQIVKCYNKDDKIIWRHELKK